MSYLKKKFPIIYNFLLITVLTFIIAPIHAIWFESRYLVPDLCPTPIINDRRTSSYATGGPFVMSADEAYPECFGRNRNHKIGLYELTGPLTLYQLDQALIKADIIGQSAFPTEWLAAGLQIPIYLSGRTETAGFFWNIAYSFSNSFLIGWSSAGYKLRSNLQINPLPENSDFPLNEAFVDQILSVYRNLTLPLGLATDPYSSSNMADNDIYMRYEYMRDFCLRMRSIKAMVQLGTLVPTSHSVQNFVAPVVQTRSGSSTTSLSAMPSGTDHHWALYGATEIDFILKEDLTLGLFLRGQYNAPKTLSKHVPVLNEPVIYGASLADVMIYPGSTWNFSPYFLFEGIREGLGCKLAYSLVAHTNDTWIPLSCKPNTIGINDLNLTLVDGYSAWGQEHVQIAIFYDFSRELWEHRFQPFVNFSVQLPVDWFAARNAAKTYGLACTVEILY